MDLLNFKFALWLPWRGQIKCFYRPCMSCEVDAPLPQQRLLWHKANRGTVGTNSHLVNSGGQTLPNHSITLPAKEGSASPGAVGRDDDAERDTGTLPTARC